MTMLGTLDKVDGRWRLRFTRHLRHPPAKVWRALTEPEHLGAWFPAAIEGERAAGARLRFAFPDDAARPRTARCSPTTRRRCWSSAGARSCSASSCGRTATGPC
jgi:hypothetical protein